MELLTLYAEQNQNVPEILHDVHVPLLRNKKMFHLDAKMFHLFRKMFRWVYRNKRDTRL